MNRDQVLGQIKILLSAGGPVAGLATIYGFPQDKTALWLGLAMIVVPWIVTAAWDAFSKTDRAKVTAAGAMTGVMVTVDSTAPAGAKAAAADDAVPGVNPTATPVGPK
jgi:ABC-type tungstate transport system substrate-binding protein